MIKNSRILMALLGVAAMSPVASLAAVSITSVDVTQGGSTFTATTTNTINDEAYLSSFVAGGITYSSFTYVSSAANLNFGSPLTVAGVNSAENPTQLAAVTDARIDTAAVNVTANSDFFFDNNGITSSDVLFLFDWGGVDSGADYQLIDSSGNLLGQSVDVGTITEFGALHFNYTEDGANNKTNDMNGVAISFSEFLIGGDDSILPDVAGFRFQTNGAVDLVLAGHTAIPEPSSVALICLGCLALMLRRRRS